MKEKINSQELKDFLQNFETESTTEILEEGAKKKEIIKIAKARGINLKENRDLAGFKNVYAFANKANKNKARLPKKTLLKALPTMLGKPVDIDHERGNVVGHYIDYRYIQKDDSVVAYGVFYKSHFGDKWEKAKQLFKDKKLATSYEIWCPPDKRKELEDGTYELQEMEIAGGAILFNTEPAFEDAKVLEIAKKKIVNEDLVLASNYKDEDILTADYFLEQVKKNVQKRNEEEKQPKKEEPKVEEKTSEKPKEEVKEEKKEEPKETPGVEKVKCQNCETEFDSRVEDTNVKCPKCFAVVDKTGKVVYPPQIIDFNLSCPSCNENRWILLSNAGKSSKIKCQSCAKEYEIDFKTNETGLKGDKEEVKEKIPFLYTTNARCYQCGKIIPVSGTSKIETYELTCPQCGLKFSFDKTKSDKKKTINKVTEITPEKVNKSSKEGGEDMVIPQEITEKKEPEKAEKKHRLTKGSIVYDTLKERGELTEEDEKNAIEPDPNAKSLVDIIKEEQQEQAKQKATKEEKKEIIDVKLKKKKDWNEKKQEPKEKYYKTKSLRKAVNKIKGLKEEKDLTKSNLEEKAENYKEGIKKTASLVISLRKEITKIKEERDFYKSNAKEITERKNELGDEFSKELSDKDILDDEKFETAKLKKENALLRASAEDSEDIVGSKINERDSDWYAEQRNKINDYAYGKKKRNK